MAVFFVSVMLLGGFILAKYIWDAIVRDINLIVGYGRMTDTPSIVLVTVGFMRCTVPVIMLGLVIFSIPVLSYMLITLF